MSFGEVINGGLGAIASIYNTVQQNKWSRLNYKLQKESQDEAKFMNRNQFQVQSADALKAGINPLAMSGGQVSSASAQNVEAPQLDLSGVQNVLGAFIQQKHESDLQKKAQEFQSSENAKNRQHEEQMEALKIEAENKRHSESLAQSQKQFDANLDEIKNYHTELMNIENSKISVDKKRNQIEEARLKLEQSTQDSLNSLRQQQYKLNRADLMSRVKELANLFATGEKQHNNNSMIGIFKRLGVELGGGSKREEAYYKAIMDYLDKNE